MSPQNLTRNIPEPGPSWAAGKARKRANILRGLLKVISFHHETFANNLDLKILLGFSLIVS